MRLCLPARMGGGGKAESLPWRGPAGATRPPHGGGYSALGTRGQSPWRSRLTGNWAGQAPLSRSAAYNRHPRMARRRRVVWRQAKREQGCCPKGIAPPVPAKARPSPDRQGEKRECQRVSSKTPHPHERAARDRVRRWKLPLIFLRAPDRHQNGQDLRLGPRQRIEQVAARQRQSLFPKSV